MRIAIIGAGGFIGSHLTRRLLKLGHKVVAVDPDLDRIRGLVSNTNLAIAREKVGSKGLGQMAARMLHLVINCASTCRPHEYVLDPVRVMEENGLFPVELGRWCLEHRIRLIHFSSCEVYGQADIDRDTGKPRLMEATARSILGPVDRPRWSYAAAKLFADHWLYNAFTQAPVPLTIVRPFNWIGPGMDYEPEDERPEPRVVPAFLGYLKQGKPLPLVDGGQAGRVFTDIDDAMDLMERIVASKPFPRAEIVDAGNPDNHITIADLAQMMIEQWGEGSVVTVPSQCFYGAGYEDCDDRWCDISYAKSVYSWQPKIDLRETLQRVMGA